MSSSPSLSSILCTNHWSVWEMSDRFMHDNYVPVMIKSHLLITLVMLEIKSWYCNFEMEWVFFRGKILYSWTKFLQFKIKNRYSRQVHPQKYCRTLVLQHIFNGDLNWETLTLIIELEAIKEEVEVGFKMFRASVDTLSMRSTFLQWLPSAN